MDRKTITNVFKKSYLDARKKDKGKILSDFIKLTNYNRNYAANLLRQKDNLKIVKKRKHNYDKDVEIALVKIWTIMDYICGQRLAPILPEIIDKLEQFNELTIEKTVKQKLIHISSATIDRLLSPYRKKLGRRGQSLTTPGNFLKKQIPIRTYGEWPESEVGYLEIDLVAHEGGDNTGNYFHTLNATEINSSWTTSILLKGKDQESVLQGIVDMEISLPFKILGIDCDNGSEFINYKMLEFCTKNSIHYTRSRPYKKNDNCHIEQKNYSVVRRNIGYLRYDTEDEFKIISNLFTALNLYNNYFLPSKKLIRKEKIGSKYIRKYNKPATPYQRIINNKNSLPDIISKLNEIYKKLNPVELKSTINDLQDKLIEITKTKREYIKNYMDKEDLYRLNRYRKRNVPAKRNPSVFVEKQFQINEKDIKTEKLKKKREAIEILDNLRRDIKNHSLG